MRAICFLPILFSSFIACEAPVDESAPGRQTEPTHPAAGVLLHADDGGWFVAAVADGSPAEQLGLHAGQRIDSVAGKTLTAATPPHEIFQLFKAQGRLPVAHASGGGACFDCNCTLRPAFEEPTCTCLAAQIGAATCELDSKADGGLCTVGRGCVDL